MIKKNKFRVAYHTQIELKLLYSQKSGGDFYLYSLIIFGKNVIEILVQNLN